jgi:hypothetical protein
MNTVETFKAAIAEHGGEQRVLSLIFNNAYTKTFVDDAFSFAANLDEAKGYVKFVERDPKGIRFTVLKPLEYIEGIIFAQNDADIPKIDLRYIHG